MSDKFCQYFSGYFEQIWHVGWNYLFNFAMEILYDLSMQDV